MSSVILLSALCLFLFAFPAIEQSSRVHATPILILDPSTDIEPDLSDERGLPSGVSQVVRIALLTDILREALGDKARDELVIFDSQSIPFGENFPLGFDLVLLSAPSRVPEASSFLLFGLGVVIVGVIVGKKRRK